MNEEEDLYGVIDRRNIDQVVFGDYEFDTWYGNSAYFVKNAPQELGYQFINKATKMKPSAKVVAEYKEKFWLPKLFVCNFCFKYTQDEILLERHRTCCAYRYKLPGRVMYRDDLKKISIRKIRGKRHKLFCQNMCLFGKLFLDNKSVFFNLENYDFYVIYGENQNQEAMPMGFFSKELLSWDGNNLACILVFPPFQKQKLGQVLISFSYELSRFESKISGPEHPLSTFGKNSYLSYWSKYLAREFLTGELSGYENTSITLQQISSKTGFRVDDVVMALDNMKCLLEFGNKNIYDDYEDAKTNLESDYDVVILKHRIQEWSQKKDITRCIKVENLILH